ncbi:MAG: hypothetical protein LBU19_10455, partial [Treponema sp.]|nr:hypothetical protein [Treponema sp.]
MRLSTKVSLWIGALMFFIVACIGIASVLVAAGIVEHVSESSLLNQAKSSSRLIQEVLNSESRVFYELANRARTQTM